MTEQRDEAESVIKELAKTLRNSEAGEHLDGLHHRLVELRSTEQELERVERDHKLGYIKDDDYFHRHDQLNLRRNTLLEEIKEQNLLPIIEGVKEPGSKSKLRKIADTVVSYKDALKALAEIAGAAARGFLGV